MTNCLIAALFANFLPLSALAEDPPKQAADQRESHLVQDVPADAKEVRPDIYRREENGKLYIYIKAPIGVTRAEQSEDMRKLIDVMPPMGIYAKENKEEFSFDRQTPFGKVHWVKKKESTKREDKLNQDEKDALEYARLLNEKVEAKAKKK